MTANPEQAITARLKARCEGRYPVPQQRDEPFPVTYRCALEVGHRGPHGGHSLDDWHAVALRVGERLAADGPHGYYHFTPVEWADWCLAHVETLQQENDRLKALLVEISVALSGSSLRLTGGPTATVVRQLIERAESADDGWEAAKAAADDTKDYFEMAERLRQAEAERDAARAALKTYVKHAKDCDIVTDPRGVPFCTCGLDAALGGRAD